MKVSTKSLRIITTKRKHKDSGFKCFDILVEGGAVTNPQVDVISFYHNGVPIFDIDCREPRKISVYHLFNEEAVVTTKDNSSTAHIDIIDKKED